MHGAGGIEVVPGGASTHPAGGHDAAVGEVEPPVGDHRPAGGHRTRVGHQVVPGSPLIQPTGDLHARAVVVVPGAVPVHPSGEHVAVLVESEHSPVQGEGLVLGVVAARDLPPPADAVVDPHADRTIGRRRRVGRGRGIRRGIGRRRGIRRRRRVGRGRGIRRGIGSGFLGECQGHQTRFTHPSLVQGSQAHDRAVVLPINRERDLRGVLVIQNRPGLRAGPLDLPQQRRHGLSAHLGLDRDLRALRGGHRAEGTVTADPRVLGRAGAHHQGLDDGCFLLAGIGIGGLGGEGLDLGERKLTVFGGLKHADVAGLEALEVDRARAAADTVNLDHVDAVDGPHRRGVEGGIEVLTRGDHPEVVEALVAGRALAVVRGGSVPHVDDAEGVALAQVDLPPRIGLLTGVGHGAVIPHAVCVAVDGALGLTAPAGGGLGGCLVQGQVLATLRHAQRGPFGGHRAVGVGRHGVELCAVVGHGRLQGVRGVGGAFDHGPLSRTLGHPVPLDGSRRPAGGDDREGGDLAVGHRHRGGLGCDDGRLRRGVVSIDVNRGAQLAHANRVGVVGGMGQLDAQGCDHSGVQGESLTDFAGLDLGTRDLHGGGSQGDPVGRRVVEGAVERQSQVADTSATVVDQVGVVDLCS